MQLYFIRHGESKNNELLTRTGSSLGRSEDPELTDMGRRQAEILAEFLSRTGSIVPVEGNDVKKAKSSGVGAASAGYKSPDVQNAAGFGLTHLYTSLMIRAVATGTVIAGALGLPLVAWEDLHESGGIYLKDEETGERVGGTGKNRAYFEAHYPDLVLPESLGEAGWWNRPFEEPEERPIRARRFLGDLIERHGGTEDRVGVVSHGGFYNHFLVALLNMSGREGYWFHINNTAITRVDFHAEGVNLAYMNRVDFLPRELIT